MDSTTIISLAFVCVVLIICVTVNKSIKAKFEYHERTKRNPVTGNTEEDYKTELKAKERR